MSNLVAAIIGGAVAIFAQWSALFIKHTLDVTEKEKKSRKTLKSYLNYYREELVVGQSIIADDLQRLNSNAYLSPNSLPHHFWDGYHLSEESICSINEIGNDEEKSTVIHLSRCFTYIPMMTDSYKRLQPQEQNRLREIIINYYNSANGGYELTVRLVNQLIAKIN